MTAEYSRKIESLYLAMYDKLMAYARSTFRNEDSAEEAVQETFRIACMKPEALFESPNPEGWLVVTLKHVICNVIRSRQSASRFLASYTETDPRSLVISEDRHDLSLLYGNVAQSDEFQLIREMAVEGCSHNEMAQKRGISVDACKKRVQRAKIFLRKKLS